MSVKDSSRSTSAEEPLSKKLCYLAIAIVMLPGLVLASPFLYILDRKYDAFCP